MPERSEPDWPPMADRLGGRWLLSWQGVVVIGIGFPVSVVLGDPQTLTSARVLLGWLALVLVAEVVAVLYMLVCGRLPVIAGRREHPAPVPVAVSFLAGSVLVAELTLGAGASLLGLPSSFTPAVRVVASVLIATPILVGIVLLLDALDRLRAERSRMLERAVLAQLVQAQQSLLAEELRHEIEADVARVLDPMRRDLLRRLDDAETERTAPAVGALASAMRASADVDVRGLSARLWVPPDARAGQPRAWRMLPALLSTATLHPWFLALAHVLGSGPLILTQFGVTVGATMVVTVVGYVLVVGALLNAWLRRSRHRVRAFVVSVFAIQAVVLPMAWWRGALDPGSGSLGEVVASLVAGTALILFSSGLSAWSDHRRQLVEALQGELDAQHVRSLAHGRLLADAARETSLALHGSLQTRLVACAMASEQAIAADDEAMLADVLAQTRTLLERHEPVLTHETDVAYEVRGRLAPWAELVDADVDLDDAVAGLSGPVAVVLGRVVEEAVSNAMRHGDATRIGIAIRQGADGIVVTVDDDGCGPQHGRRGIGSALLDQATGGAWSLERTNDGSRLTAVVRVRESPPRASGF